MDVSGRRLTVLRNAVNVVNLSTPLGHVVARVGGARVHRGDRGLWLAEGYRLGFPRAGAFTIGDVVITESSIERLAGVQPDVLAHEELHSWQWAAMGPIFLPLYVAASALSWIRTRDPAILNPFERHAGLVTGGYLAEDADVPALWRRRVSERRGGGPTGSLGGADGAGEDA